MINYIFCIKGTLLVYNKICNKIAMDSHIYNKNCNGLNTGRKIEAFKKLLMTQFCGMSNLFMIIVKKKV